MAIMTIGVTGEERVEVGDLDESGPQPSVNQIVNTLPDEFCVVVSLDDPPADDRAAGDLRESVRLWLNRELPILAREGPANEQIAQLRRIEPRLTPVRLLDDLRAGGEVLRKPEAGEHSGLKRWLIFPREHGATVLLFYTIGLAGLPGVPLDKVVAQLERARELTNLINCDLRLQRGMRPVEITEEGLQTWRVLFEAGHGDWLFNAASSDGPSPGSLPKPAQGGEWRFAFPEGLACKLAEADESDVLVAVLDTCPTKQEVLHAADGSFPDNWLLQRIGQEIQAGRGFTIDRDEAQPLLDNAYYDSLQASYPMLLPNLLDQQPDLGANVDDYRLVDHGLFVAGIIRSIAPFANIRLIRALADNGTGDMFAVATILRELPDRLGLAQRDVRLVVNLSLGADVPLGDRHFQGEYPNLHAKLVELGQPDVRFDDDVYGELRRLEKLTGPVGPLARQALDLLQGSHSGLQAAVSWLTDPDGAVTTGHLQKRALIVAASGNDHDDRITGSLRKEPRLPAGYDNVLSTAALEPDFFGPSCFTNRGDERVLRDGIATLGGNARRSGVGALPLIEGQDTGVVGVFSSTRLRPPRKGEAPMESESHWGSWSGTSFAAPIISAVAARLWARRPDLEPWDVNAQAGAGAGTTPPAEPGTLMDLIRSFTDTGGTTPPGSPISAPSLRVKQLRTGSQTGLGLVVP